MAERGGQPGNKNAERGARWRNAIDRALDMHSKALGQEALVKIALSLIEKAGDGDLAAMRELGDRLDGKAAQSLTLGGDENNPLQSVHKVEIVALTSDD